MAQTEAHVGIITTLVAATSDPTAVRILQALQAKSEVGGKCPYQFCDWQLKGAESVASGTINGQPVTLKITPVVSAQPETYLIKGTGYGKRRMRVTLDAVTFKRELAGARIDGLIHQLLMLLFVKQSLGLAPDPKAATRRKQRKAERQGILGPRRSDVVGHFYHYG